MQNIELYKKLSANLSRYCLGISNINDMVEISKFLEMKMEAVAFKGYTSCEISKCFKAKVGKAFLAQHDAVNATGYVS